MKGVKRMAELRELQDLVKNIRAKRGFTTDPLRIFVLLNEEIGEVAQELKKIWSKNYSGFSNDLLADELADVLVCLIALANQFEIDLDRALNDKLVKKDSQREWKSASRKEEIVNEI